MNKHKRKKYLWLSRGTEVSKIAIWIPIITFTQFEYTWFTFVGWLIKCCHFYREKHCKPYSMETFEIKICKLKSSMIHSFIFILTRLSWESKRQSKSHHIDGNTKITMYLLAASNWSRKCWETSHFHHALWQYESQLCNPCVEHSFLKHPFCYWVTDYSVLEYRLRIMISV